VAFLAGLIGGVGYLIKNLKMWIGKAFAEQLQPINEDLDKIMGKLTNVDLESCKNFLVRFIADVERGERISETEQERFWEQYEHYLNSGGNSYIKQRVEKLKNEGKI
jgi:hypothetical protein